VVAETAGSRLNPTAPVARPGAGRLLQFGVPLFGVFVGVLLVAGPFAATIVRSILVWTDGAAAVSLSNFTQLLGDSRFYEALGNTLICSAGATLISCVLGFGLAWIVSRTNVPGRSWFEVGNLIPFFLSPYVGAISWTYLAAPHSGLIQHFFRRYLGIQLDFLDIYGMGGAIWVLSLFYTPYVYLFVISPLRQMDAALEDAGRVHGASFWYTLRHITIPLLAPALLSGALIVFVTSAGLFDIPLALASPRGIRMIPTELYGAVQYPSDFGRAAAIGVLVMIVTVAFTILQRRYLGRRRYETVSGKGYKPRIIHLKGWRKVAALAVEIIYIGSGVVLPIIALLMVSFSSIWTGTLNTRMLTLDNYSYVLFGYGLTQRAIANSLYLALVGATIGVVLAVLHGYFLNRGPVRWRGIADVVLSLPLGIPGIILGLGYLILALRTPLYSTLTIVLIAYVARFLPFATRTVSAMFQAVNPELEQSARSSGATWLQTMRYVLLPLLRPALVAAWLMLFVIFIRELGATILLYAQGTETISVALVILSERNFGYVSALAVIQLVLLLGAFALFRITRTSIVQS
jgi:iron(III) transport system permease protein